MAEERDNELMAQTLRAAWPDLEPDPQAMERVVTLMATRVSATPASDVSQFRLLTLVFGAALMCGYLIWPLISAWLLANPFWAVILVAFGIISLVTPFLLPLLTETDSTGSTESRGGVTLW